MQNCLFQPATLLCLPVYIQQSSRESVSHASQPARPAQGRPPRAEGRGQGRGKKGITAPDDMVGMGIRAVRLPFVCRCGLRLEADRRSISRWVGDEEEDGLRECYFAHYEFLNESPFRATLKQRIEWMYVCRLQTNGGTTRERVEWLPDSRDSKSARDSFN